MAKTQTVWLVSFPSACSHLRLLCNVLAFAALCLPVGMTTATETNLDHWKLPVPLQGHSPAPQLWPASSISAADCGLCHPKQYFEWQRSFHAKSTSPGLLGQLEAFDEDMRRMCLNCHAPRREQQDRLDVSRPEIPLDGVDCASCHVRSHQRFGPRDTPLTPHGTVLARSLFWSSDFCAPCHQFDNDDVAVNGKLLEDTLEEWQSSSYAAQDIHCQDCHMPSGSHRFRGIHDPDMLRQGLAFTVQRTPDGVTAAVTNRGTGHALPTYITPRIRVILHSPGRKASAELIIQRAMSWDEQDGWRERFDTRLLPGETRRIKLELRPQELATATVVVEPDADYHDRVYPFLIERLNGQVSAAAMRQLKLAHSTAAASPYTAYKVDCGSAQNETYACE